MESNHRNPEFSAVRGRYERAEVDEYVRSSAETIRRLEERVAQLEELPVEERVAAARLEADRLLDQAREQADVMIAQAVSREAHEIVTTMNARVELETALDEVRGEASHILDEARAQADTILGEVRSRAENLYTGVVDAMGRGALEIGPDPTAIDLSADVAVIPLLDADAADPGVTVITDPDDDSAAAELAAAVDAVTALLGEADRSSISAEGPSLWDSSEDPELAEHPFFSEEIDDDPSRKWILAS